MSCAITTSACEMRLRSGAVSARLSAAARRACARIGARRRFRPDGHSLALAGEHHAPVIVEIAVERRDLAALHQPEPVGAGFQQIAVVRDQDHRAGIIVDRLDQRGAAVDVEMVGRLVEDDEMRRGEGRKAEQQPRLLAAGKSSSRRCWRRARKSRWRRRARALWLPAHPASAGARDRRGCVSSSSSSSWCWAK